MATVVSIIIADLGQLPLPATVAVASGLRGFEVAERDALPVLIASLTEDGGGVVVRGDRLVESLRRLQGEAKALQRQAFAVAVGGVAEDGDGVLAGGDGPRRTGAPRAAGTRSDS